MSSALPDEELRVLVTGGHGFVGKRLTALLAARHPSWILAVPSGPIESTGDQTLDVTDEASVHAAVVGVKPDVVIHLAAITAVTASTQAPREAWRVNLDGTLNLVSALQDYAPEAHLLFVSSAEVYGASLRNQKPADESVLLQPLNPYAASKAAADLLVRQVAATGLSATIMRPFNHIGPGQSEAFVAASFAGQIARIEAGLQPPVLLVGNLDDERDFLDVDDVIRAYAAVIEARASLDPGEVFNVASGRSIRVGDLLESLLSKARVTIEVREDPSRLRRVPTPRVVGDASRLRHKLGWQPETALEDTLVRILLERRSVAKQ